jgi:hypothetical protein
VLEAIREQRFYILTHPEWTPMIEQRTQRIISGEPPAPALPPETESLTRLLQERMK